MVKEAIGSSVGTRLKLANRKPITSAIGEDTKGVKQNSSANPKGIFFVFKGVVRCYELKRGVYSNAFGQKVLMN
ncbi:hypothetical protein VH1709_contig00034-0005 [Vibrio harveyi]|nr:hypothetical protein VH1709_contig00034-0005 [Vibrio harveyi]